MIITEWLFVPRKKEREIKIQDHPVGDIPAGENPYRYDPFNVGLPLGDFLMDDRLNGVEIMSFDTYNKEERKFQIIDTTTGKRTIIVL